MGWTSQMAGGWRIVFLMGALTAGAVAFGAHVSAAVALEEGAAMDDRQARVPLPDLDAAGLRGFEPVAEGRVPNYLRAFRALPDGPALLGEMAHSVLYEGTVDPGVKMAMGLAIALPDRSPYTAVHMRRLLAVTADGRLLADAVAGGTLGSLGDADRVAIDLALALTESVNGLDDEQFAELRRWYNEPQIVEITLVACFFNYFNRLVEAMNLPVERWAIDEPAVRWAGESTGTAAAAPAARIGLLGDREVQIIAERLAAGQASSSLGLRIANSVRAMARVPDIREAWANLGAVLRDSEIGPLVQHLVSNEVSYRNDCYYCKTHQVQKLRRVGMSPQHIARIVDSDETLDDSERLAVRFARQVTDDPAAVTEEQFAALRGAFGDRGALEVLQVAARFNFMNRFTSGLNLPPEDAPRETYEQVEAARQGQR